MERLREGDVHMDYFSQESKFISIERILIDDIPCLRVRPRGEEKEIPTIIYYHGWGSCKDNQRFKASAFALYGYQVILPDALYHGERNPIKHGQKGMLREYFLKVILNSLEESKGLIRGIIEDYGGDPERIGVTGHSMGGFISAGVFAFNEDLKCLVVYNGSCGWMEAERIYRETRGIGFSEEDVVKLEKYDPMNNIDKIVDRPILMVHGDEDSSVPIDSQRIFYQKVLPHYRDKEKIKLLEIPNMNHYISTGMMEEGLKWFEKYLL